MKIFDTKIITYQVMPIGTKISGWGARGKVFTPDGVIETGEVLGNTKEDVEAKAKELLNKLLQKISLQ